MGPGFESQRAHQLRMPNMTGAVGMKVGQESHEGTAVLAAFAVMTA